MSRPHRRRGQRRKTRLKALYSSGGQSGDALLTEISYSGARLESRGLRPPRGRPISVFVWLENQEEPFELVGRVAGLRPDGFAIEYERPGQDVCLMVDLAANSIAQQPLAEGPASPPPSLAGLDLSAYALGELEGHAARVREAIAARRRAANETEEPRQAGES